MPQLALIGPVQIYSGLFPRILSPLHLVRKSSNHSPIFLSRKPSPSPKNSPFEFEEIWLTHPSFIDLTRDVEI